MTPVGRALHFRRGNENLSSSADVLHKTKNLAISRCCFADDGNEMDKSEKRTCRACKFVTFSLPSPLSLLKLPSVSPRTNTIASRDQFKPIRIGENLVVKYNSW